MTPRPAPSVTSRPLSAIYIGPNISAHSSSYSSLPDLPEPPSPGGSSNGSGLPSPPATNSTGSGSTGGNSTNSGSIRQRPLSLDSANMSNGVSVKTPTATLAHQSRMDDEEDDRDNDNNDEDNTAKQTLQQTQRQSTENVLALQRVKSLTQRNRMALDKLSSISRLATASPTRTPARPPPPRSSSASSSSKSSSSRLSARSHTRSQSQAQPTSPGLDSSQQSGSETERESEHANNSSSAAYSSSSEDLLASITSSTRPQSSLGLHRQRRTSAPTSPAKAMTRANSTLSSTHLRTPRRKLSGSRSAEYLDDKEGRVDDVTSAALAAVASSRRSPTSSGKKRAAIPREFTGGSALDDKPGGEPSTPYNRPSPTARISFATDTSPRGPRFNRPSVRELVKRHQARWKSEDSTSSPYGTRGLESATGEDSPGFGRTLVGEGLKAAGIKKKENDVFGDAGEQSALRRSYTGGTYHTRQGGSIDWAAEVRAEQAQAAECGPERSRSRASERISESSGRPPSRGKPDLRTLDTLADLSSRALLTRSTNGGSRPSTASPDMRREGDDEPPLRSALRSSMNPERDRSGAGSSLARYPTPQERSVPSPLGIRRYSPHPGSSANQSPLHPQHTSAEHARLMMDSLSIFESSLARLPNMGPTTAATVPDLFRAAESIVHASEKLNGLLRGSTNRALEEQIDAEVGAMDDQGTELAEFWRKVGGDFRESLRVSDDLVRSMTGFLLGVGKVLKETLALSGDVVEHPKRASLDDAGLRRGNSEIGRSDRGSNGRASVEGRRSMDDAQSESRRSWDMLSRDSSHGDGLRRSSSRVDEILASVSRPSSALKIRDLDTGPSTATTKGVNVLSSSVRRLFSPREQRERDQQLNARAVNSAGILASDSMETIQSHEPSPTPASRKRQSLPVHSRALPPLAIPSPLPTLPSESLLRRSTDAGGDRNTQDRKKGSTTSIATVRPSASATSPFPVLTTPNPTTAVTAHTVSNAPERTAFPMHRSISGPSRNTVTFSKPSAVSVSALSGLQQQHQLTRTLSMTSDLSSPGGKAGTVSMPATPLSGGDTERDRRRTMAARSSRVSMELSGVLQNDRRGERDSSSQARAPLSNTMRRERRQTLTEIFSPG